MIDAETLRPALHAAIDRAFDDFLAGHSDEAPSAPDAPNAQVLVVPADSTAEWTYRWPGGDKEHFFETRWYDTDGPRGQQRVRVAWAVRSSWGRADRKRAIVFNQLGSADSTTYYPWTEFVETDDGRYAAPIPDPDRPRATIADPARLPGRFDRSVVERSDLLFHSVTDGPSLRLVVHAGDEASMVKHGYWVATIRRRI